MDLIWFPITKAVVSAVLLWFAIYLPLSRYDKARKRSLEEYRAGRAEGTIPVYAEPSTPTFKLLHLLPLVLLLLLFVLTPFRLVSTEQSERVILRFDPPVREVPVIEARPRAQYSVPDNKEAIHNLLNKEVTE